MSKRLSGIARFLMVMMALQGGVEPAFARGGRGGGGGGHGGFHGGGGGRPSMGRMSGGGGGGMSRPVSRPAPSASRPSFSQARPSAGGMSRPGSVGTAARPGGAGAGARPGYAGAGGGIGGARPSFGHSASFPNISAGGARPGQGAGAPRPGQIGGTRPGQGGAGTRPGQPGGNRPGAGGIARPGDRPGGIGGNTRPGDRPGGIGGNTRPGDRPGNIGRPGDIGGGNRPGQGGNRPGGDNRPWIGNGGRPSDRPGDRPGNRPGDRPVIGGNNINRGNINSGNRAVIGGHNNVNFNNFNNRAGWGMGRYGYGYRPGTGNWAGHWHNHYVNPGHWGWYHGCWGGHWGNNWYTPLVFGATAWGLGALTASWGYGYGGGYSNPYYSSGSGYDYSQPVSVASYGAADEGSAAATAAAAPAAPAPPSSFEEARAQFLAGDYAGAQKKTETALAESPKDPVIHEFYALCLFAQGEYDRAASVLNSLLASSPGMDWTTLVSLYPSQSVYLQQFKALEDYCSAHPKDAPSHFVLAYHLLVRGESNAAIDALQVAVDNQPKDQVAARMLAAMKGDSSGGDSAVASADAATGPALAAEPTPPAPETADDGPTTDLTGFWQAVRDENKFELTIDPSGTFDWKAAPKGGQPVELKGNYAVAGDLLNLESKDQGIMAGRVKSGGADSFQFIPADSPSGDTGLNFTRVKSG